MNTELLIGLKTKSGGGNSLKINSLVKRAISTFFAVIFFFALGAMVDSREARGQSCPPGYAGAKVNFWVGGCEFTALFCYLCPPTHFVEVELMTIIPKDTGTCAEITPAVEAAACDAIAALNYSFCDVGPCELDPNGKPINPVATNMHINVKACRYAVNTVIDLGGGNYHNSFEYWYCGDSFCSLPYAICVDYSTSPPTQITIKKFPVHFGSVDDCVDRPSYLNNPVQPPPGETWQTSWQSPCYTFNRQFPCDHLNP